MANNLAELTVALQLQSQSFEKGMNRVERQIQKSSRSTKQMTAGFKSAQAATSSFLRTAAGLAGIGFGASFLKSVIETNSQMAKMSRQVGLTAEQYQVYEFAATRAGISTAQMGSNLTAFVKRMGEARAGMGPLVSGLKNLNPELLANLTASKNQNEALKVLAEGFRNAGSATERAAIANAAFSRSGVRMSEIFVDGAESISKASAEAKALGLIMSNDLVAASERYDDALGDLQARMTKTFGMAFLKTVKFTADESGKVLAAFFGSVEKSLNALQAHWKFTWQLGFVDIIKTAINLMTAPMRNYFVWIADKLSYFNKDFKDMGEKFNDFLKLDVDQTGWPEIQAQLDATNALVDEGVLAYFRQVDAVNEARDAGLEMARTLREQENATAKLNNETDKAKDKLKSWASGMLDAADPTRQFARDMVEVGKAVKAGFFDMEQAAVIIDQLHLALDKKLNPEAFKGVKEEVDDLKKTIEGFAQEFANRVGDAVQSGKLSFGDFADYVTNQILRIVLTKAFEPFFNMIAGQVSDLFGSGTTAGTSIGGGGSTRAAAIRTPGTSFIGKVKSPSYGFGAERGGGSSSGASKIIINNNAPVEVEARETQGPDGRTIEIAIEQAVNKQIGQGSFDKSFGASFGLKRRAY